MNSSAVEKSRPLLTTKTSPAGSPSRSHIDALDGLRGAAILMVLLYHYLANIGGSGVVARAVMGIPHSGWCGVDLFFVLSGYLITGILYDAKPSASYFKNFYARRTLRIFPLYYGALFVIFGILPFFANLHSTAMSAITHNQIWLWIYGSNLVMGWHEHFFFNGGWLLLGHFWTLAIEEQFYLLWPAVIRFFNRTQAIAACLIIIVALPIVRTILMLGGGHKIEIYIAPYCRMDTLAVGALIALMSRGTGGIAALRTPAKYVGLISLLGIVALFLPNLELNNVSPWVETIGFTLLAFFFGAALIHIVAANPKTAAARFWTLTPLRSLGKYSYAMYIFHLVLLPVYERLFPPGRLRVLLHSTRISEIAFALLAGFATYLAAFVSWHLYEKHFLKLKRYFVYQRTDGPAP